nr:hypothetical protein MarFTME_014 [Marseillevirus futianmevirus]
MEYSKKVCLCAKTHKGKWYFSVHDSEEQTEIVVCSIKFPVYVPISGILTPESEYFGRLDEAIQKFIASASRIAHESILESVSELDNCIEALDSAISKLVECNENELSRRTATILGEKIHKKDALSELGEHCFKRCRKVDEGEPGVVGLLRLVCYDEEKEFADI